jgi:hypothetical protein
VVVREHGVAADDREPVDHGAARSDHDDVEAVVGDVREPRASSPSRSPERIVESNRPRALLERGLGSGEPAVYRVVARRA